MVPIRDSRRDGYNKIIYEMKMKFWAVLGRRGCRERKIPTVISSMQLFGVVFQLFVGKFFFYNFYENMFVFALKSYII